MASGRYPAPLDGQSEANCSSRRGDRCDRLGAEQEPALLHPQLFADLILAVMFYGEWGIAWVVLRRRSDFSTKQVFVLQGLYGIVLEQFGAVFLAGVLSMPLGLVLWADVFVGYGSIMGIAYVPLEPQLRRPGAPSSLWKPAIAFAGQFGGHAGAGDAIRSTSPLA